MEFIPFSVIWSWWCVCTAPSSLGLVLPSSSTHIFVLYFPILRWVSPLLFNGMLQGIAAGIGSSNFFRAALIVILNSSSSGSMKCTPLNCLAVSSFGFSIAHFLCCFLFRCIRHMIPRIWPYIIRSWGYLVPRKSPHPHQVYPSGGLSFNRINPVHASDNSRPPSTFQ